MPRKVKTKEKEDKPAHLKDKDFKKFHREMEWIRFGKLKRWEMEINPVGLLLLMIFTTSIVGIFIHAIIKAFFTP